jgi:hypothetical protein
VLCYFFCVLIIASFLIRSLRTFFLLSAIKLACKSLERGRLHSLALRRKQKKKKLFIDASEKELQYDDLLKVGAIISNKIIYDAINRAVRLDMTVKFQLQPCHVS